MRLQGNYLIMKSNIALIGFMGAGKSTVGKLLAEKLNYNFIDTDELIQMKSGKSIAEIFKQEGEMAFRELEIQVIREIATAKNTVIACGGGVPLNQINIDRLKQSSIVVFLNTNRDIILQRISTDNQTRPLLAESNYEQFCRLFQARKSLYQAVADIVINITPDLLQNNQRLLNRIIRLLKKHEDNASQKPNKR